MDRNLSPIPVAGVWYRQWEEDPLGDTANADRASFVSWTQSKISGIYVDLRLPAGSPGQSLAAAHELASIVPNAASLAGNGSMHPSNVKSLVDKPAIVDSLLRQKSFAGVLQYQKGDTTDSGLALERDAQLAQLAQESQDDLHRISLCTCFWRRDLDYQPPSGGLDIGVCASQSPSLADDHHYILLRETGHDASYAEEWRRWHASSTGPFWAMSLLDENRKRLRCGYFVRAGNHFAYAVGRPNRVSAARHGSNSCCEDKACLIKDFVGKTLAQAVRDLDLDPLATLSVAIASYVAVFGSVNDPNSKSDSWCIEQSSNPELVGCRLLGNPKLDPLCCSSFRASESEWLPSSAVASESSPFGIGHVLEQIIPAAQSITIRRWKIEEWSGGELSLEV